MVCRLLVAAGQLLMILLLDDFRLIAKTKNEEHEHWHDPCSWRRRALLLWC